MKKKIALSLFAGFCVICLLIMFTISAKMQVNGDMAAPKTIEQITEIVIEDAAASSQEPETEITSTSEVEEETIAPETQPSETVYEAPQNALPQTLGNWTYAPIPSSAKTYEAYYMITDRTSKQWPLLNEILIHGEDGMIRDQDGYIAAALGSFFGPIGSRWIFLLDNGKQIKIIKADQKQDIHTYNYNRINGYAALDIIEFIVNDRIMPKWSNGYVYGGNFNNCEEFQGTVVAWQRID